MEEKNEINAPVHYDNTNGSLYLFAENHKLNAWEFDIVKRIVRCRKKGNFKEDLNKTIEVIKIYENEFKDIKTELLTKEQILEIWERKKKKGYL